jgi:hypothetical protein
MIATVSLQRRAHLRFVTIPAINRWAISVVRERGLGRQPGVTEPHVRAPGSGVFRVFRVKKRVLFQNDRYDLDLKQCGVS